MNYNEIDLIQTENKQKTMLGGKQGCYNPEVARQGVVEIYDKLLAFEKKLAALNGTVKDSQEFASLMDEYNAFPQSYDIDWAVAGIDRNEAVAKANAVRETLNTLAQSADLKDVNIPLLFYQSKD